MMARREIMSVLSEGEENAIKVEQLSKILNMNKREITICVSKLRQNGEVICSSNQGYFLPSSVDDVKHFYRQMTSRQREIEKAKQSAKRYIEAHGETIDS